MASDTNVTNINLQNRMLDQLDEFWRETLRSGETRPNVLGKSYNEMLARMQREICHLPQAEQDRLVSQLVNRNAEYIELANRDKELKNDLRVRLGMPPLLRSQAQARNHMAQVVIDTAVRATIWQSIRGIFRLFR